MLNQVYLLNFEIVLLLLFEEYLGLPDISTEKIEGLIKNRSNSFNKKENLKALQEMMKN